MTSGHQYLTTAEILNIIDRLNRFGRVWKLYLSELGVRPRKVSCEDGVWQIVMLSGETFALLKDHGWLHIGITAQPTGRVPRG